MIRANIFRAAHRGRWHAARGYSILGGSSPAGDPALVTAPLEDPVVRAARREALMALAMWVAAMTYTLTYCYLNGYGRTVDSLTFVLWFPDWVFWGIVVPWSICILASTVFAFCILGNEPLDDEIEADSSLPPGAESEVPRD